MFSDLKMGAWKSQAPLKYQEDSFASHLWIKRSKDTLFQVKKTVRVYGSRISSFFFFCGVLHYTNAHVLHKLRNILQIIPKITLIRG